MTDRSRNPQEPGVPDTPGRVGSNDTVAPRFWTFLTNHGHVLLAIADDPHARLRDLAERVGITERAAQLIVADLERAGYVSKKRVGRRNHYTVVRGRRFRHPAESERSVDDLLAIFRG